MIEIVIEIDREEEIIGKSPEIEAEKENIAMKMNLETGLKEMISIEAMKLRLEKRKTLQRR